MQQNSNQWHEWRQKGIGSSDAPAIMGVSPYKTKLELYEEKTCPQTFNGEEKEQNFIHKKGHRLEKVARADFEFKMGKEYKPMTGERKDFPFIRASLDGFNEESNEGIEIKYVGEEYFEKTNEYKDIREDHKIQMMHQFIVTGAKVIHYVMYNDKVDLTKVISVYPDKDLCEKILMEEVKFWDLVEKKKPPELTDKDFKKVRDKQLLKLLSDYNLFLVEEKKISEWKKKAYEDIKKLINHKRVICGNFKITEVERQGSINYKSIPEVKKLDKSYLEKYRGKGSKSLKITTTD